MNSVLAEKPLISTESAAAKVRKKRKIGREEAKYWSLWGEIGSKFKLSAAEREAWRREITEEIFGEYKSHGAFTHGDYDVVLGAMRELLARLFYTVSARQRAAERKGRTFTEIYETSDNCPF